MKNLLRMPTIGYLGRFAPGDSPDAPAVFKSTTGVLYTTDGKHVFGPHSSELEARNELSLFLIKRQRVRFEVYSISILSIAISVLCLLLAR